MKLDKCHPKVDFMCRISTSSMAISAVQICVFSALAEGPTKVFTLRDCFRALKNGNYILDSTINFAYS